MKLLTAPMLATLIVVSAVGLRPAAQDRAGADCVTIGKPDPGREYAFTHVESTGKTTQTTQRWETVTDTGSRVRTTGPAGVVIQVNEHRIVNDAMVLGRSTKLDANGMQMDATSFKPGLVGDPAFRACAGQSWQIPPVTAQYQSGSVRVSSATPTGSLRIVALREKITVPAGTFETVHYIRTSQSVDEYWKSLEHGVVVKHIAKVGGHVVTETLTAIK